MSNTDSNSSLSSSRDCPVVSGKRLVQHVEARKTDVGGIPVARALPTRGRRTIGAWCFLDHAGPVVFRGNSRGMRVGPHPHIGLQTFTWMIAGEVLHRDSLGSEQVIRPGEVNLMTAGNGICHTEESVEASGQLHAAQLWIALPYADRETAPRFDHYPYLPRWEEQGADMTLLMGHFRDHNAPTLAFSPLIGIDLAHRNGGAMRIPLRTDYEYGLLPLEGTFDIGGETFRTNELAYFGTGRSDVEFHAPPGGRAILLGGEPVEDEILMWWNFVGYSKSEIAQAQREWEQGSDRFGSVPAYEGERLMPPPIPWKVDPPASHS
ncbi:pirin family protein [Marinobacter nanhaiticus D15-8W]|uniref:Pirin family protein n=1 Tax=Marinobacter nanhaiticus D15-8W TaxID=626887 RepID=N6WXX3_9GAMM|nr:pirin family protein [Marinobacter nanhaiticus]ENO16451.1 pirin family protein [Marinobacter nanhaiticus D15-8W]BES72238.1 pirin family protein [Marinobacter nanhaiticus D15-8W]